MTATTEPIGSPRTETVAPVARRGELRTLSQQLADDIAGMVDSVHSLVDLAESHDDPRLHRFAATTRKRMESVIATSESLRETTVDGAHAVQGARPFDLGQAVNRALRAATFAAGRGDIECYLSQAPLLVLGDQFDTERAITHLITVALHHSTDGRAMLALRPGGHRGGDAAELTLTAVGSALSAAEIARIIARFESADGRRTAAVASTIRVVDGEIVASSAGVQVRSNRVGTTFLAAWPIDRG